MAYRNGTYVAFHADGNNIPGKTDIDYYNLMKAWAAKGDDSFTMINSHDKASAVRDSSLRETLRKSLKERLCNSKNMVLIIGDTTKNDKDWVPFEIEQAVDQYKIPIIVAYTVFSGPIRKPNALASYWPLALATRIAAGTASAIHIPFKKAPINDAIGQFSHDNLPVGGSLTIYSNAAYSTWGIAG
ncbi:TIR domain-containing protein [Terracidiphilus gabretensis]|uniref:TIR domain-containing protein n=1 Tax=Terracidiphilus gabretensis TaxID=1577687 RepID=UPI00071BA56C|nr:TIR domain-containing protein [Terracidiphilus gabretensis]